MPRPGFLPVLAALLAAHEGGAFIIQRIEGAGGQEITNASVAGGSHIFLVGTNLGSPFSPPMVFVGSVARCDVQPFTSTKNRLHCIVNPRKLPPITADYDAAGKEVSLPLRVFKGTRLAQCWHSEGRNQNCMVLFDSAGTPRVTSVLTPVLEAGATVRVAGYGLDGQIVGDAVTTVLVVRLNPTSQPLHSSVSPRLFTSASDCTTV